MVIIIRKYGSLVPKKNAANRNGIGPTTLKCTCNSTTNTQLLPLLAYPIIYFSLFVFAFANRIYMAKWGTITHSLVVAQAVTESLKGLFSGLALIIHVAIIRFKTTKRSTTQRDDMSTISGVTPYTSGASTHFTLPNETDVDIQS